MTIDHTVIYCYYCRDNKMGIIDSDTEPTKCSVCGSRNTGPARKPTNQAWRKAKRSKVKGKTK